MHPVTCIYHKDCIDGTTAAAVVLRMFPHAHCFPLSHGYAKEDISLILSHTSPTAHIYIVDLAIAVEVFLERGHAVTVIDHHMSEENHIRELLPSTPSLTYFFDTERSGSSLTWGTFFPNEQLPQLIAHVEDSDLWRHALGENTKHVAHFLSTFRNKPEHILTLFTEDITHIIEKGKVISQYADNTIAQLTTLSPLELHIGEHRVPGFNITDHQSACGNILAMKHDCTVALFTIKGDSVKFSFRGLAHHTPSALDLAHILGGGGHRNSSGATLPLTEFFKRLTLTEIPEKPAHTTPEHRN